jgi:hypothetical protein
MPAGNDKDTALAELADQFGEGVGRAEDLIDASRARYTGKLAQAQNRPKDDEASAELDLDEVSKSAGQEVIDASVRGEFILYVYIDGTGRSQKGAFDASDLGKAESKVEKSDTAAADEVVKTSTRSKKGSARKK